MSSHDLTKDCKVYRDHHMDELRVIQSQIKFDKMSRGNKPLDEGSKLTVQPLVKIISSFIKNKGYSINDTKSILQTLGFSIDDEYIDLIKKSLMVAPSKKQTKKQEVKQYPPRYTTSKPMPPQEMTTSIRPKLNLKHLQQAKQPKSVSPNENTRKAKLSIDSPIHHDKVNKTDYSIGVVKGIEADNRIWNSELKTYKKALTRLQENNTLDLLPQKTGIHSTNDARTAVGRLVKGRLIGWR